MIVGASALKGVRLVRRGVPASLGRTLAAGVASSFAATLASMGLIGVVDRDRPLAWWAAYRCAAAGAILASGGRGTVSLR